MSTQQAAIAQRSLEKLYFDHKDMDFYFSWIMGRVIYGGCDPEECYDAASRIPNADIAAWHREWRALAERVEADADTALNRGDRAAARSAYLRACTYYRAPLFIMDPDNPAFQPGEQKMRACFQKAASLFDPPIEIFEVPFKGVPLLGYLWKVDSSTQPRPTLMVIGGMETWAEDAYFMVATSGTERGYNLLTVDVPGQGVNPWHGLFLEAKMEHPIRAVVDYALSRPEVDAKRLAMYGFSWGGHIVVNGAEHDTRIRALIANPIMPDVFRAALAQQGGHDRNDPVSKAAFLQIAWRMGLSLKVTPANIARRFRKAYEYFFFGKADLTRIHCPTLCMAGEGEAKITLDIARESMAKLPNPNNKLVIFTREEGGEAHCQVNNPALPNGVMFDWLDGLFGEPST